MRAVAIAHKLGEMAEEYQQGPEEAEPWLAFAVEETLWVVKDESNAKKWKGPGESAGEVDSMLVELDLPRWVQKIDAVVPLEVLGRFYAREGKTE